MQIVESILSISLTAAPWLFIGLLAAGLIKAFLPEALLQRWIGGRGIGPVSRAAVIGAPLPLCSCGAIPTAIALHRGGAGRGPTTAFMVGTPGIGIDSVMVTYALLGPFMALARALGAVLTAIATGLLVTMTGDRHQLDENAVMQSADDCCNKSCAGNSCASETESGPAALSASARLAGGVRYAFTDLFDDISAWLLAGLVLAGILLALVPPEGLASRGEGLPVMILLALVGIPLYICAVAATPVAAAMLLSGVAPGAVLVFLLAGPVTSMATLGVLRRELGNAALAAYFSGIMVSVLLIGLAVDALLGAMTIDIAAQIGTVQELVPDWLEWAALLILLLMAVPPLRNMLPGMNPAGASAE